MSLEAIAIVMAPNLYAMPDATAEDAMQAMLFSKKVPRYTPRHAVEICGRDMRSRYAVEIYAEICG